MPGFVELMNIVTNIIAPSVTYLKYLKQILQPNQRICSGRAGSKSNGLNFSKWTRATNNSLMLHDREGRKGMNRQTGAETDLLMSTRPKRTFVRDANWGRLSATGELLKVTNWGWRITCARKDFLW